jgi:preprotein translocase subunit SecA
LAIFALPILNRLSAMEFLNKIISAILGNKSEKDIREIQPLVDITLEIYRSLESISNDQLRKKGSDLRQFILSSHGEATSKINELKAQLEEEYDLPSAEREKIYTQIDALEDEIKLKLKAALDEALPEAFAIIKETARRFKENEVIEVEANDYDRELAAQYPHITINGNRALWKNKWMAAGSEITWDMVHYDVQLIGGIVLHQGKIAEMATGEGKTLVATLPVFLNALSGRGVHLVTVNDYLARRDSEWMGTLYRFHGLTVDCIDLHQPNSPERRKAYRSDITFGTNNEFGFDYLRDNMASSPEDLVQRKHYYAIVDEVDSVLIDDARTPLIISGPTPRGDQHMFDELKPKVEILVAEQRKLVNALLNEARQKISDSADKKTREEGGLALYRAYRAWPKYKPLIKYLSESGIKVQLNKTEAIYLQDQGKEMPFVDKELFFVIEEKQNSVQLTEKGIELITDQSQDSGFFIMPDIGTEVNQIEHSSQSDDQKLKLKDALISDYAVKSERIHTMNQLLKAYTMFEKDVEYVVIENKVKIVDEQTGRIMEGRRYSDGLHQAIEAKERVKIEAASQTYATITLQNYFRMYDKLAGMTGTAETEAGEFHQIYKLDVVVIPTNRPIQRKDTQDLVYKTAREKFNAVISEIEQLVQAGRPVLVGTTSVEISELLSRMLQRQKIKHQVLNAKLHQKEADIVAEAGKTGTVTIATNMAGRGTDIKLGPGVKDVGGLAIIGTERHESRRVDRQLRGRSGRQGDPGSSQFFVSLEDNLMRLFGSDRVANLMDRMGHKEGEVIQHSMISRSIERAQKKVEENNFGIRKRLLEYDDVMNSQREVIYTKRRHALFGERISVDVMHTIFDVCIDLAVSYHATGSYEGFKLECIKTLGLEPNIDENQFLKGNPQQFGEELFEAAFQHYQHKSERIAQSALPVIKNVFQNEERKFKNIVIPFSDGRKSIQVIADLEKSVKSSGKEATKALERAVVLAMYDQYWKEHLREMDDLRNSVQSAVYEQKDPLLIYKFEAFELFKRMLSKVNAEIVGFLMRAELPTEERQQVHQVEGPQRRVQTKVQTSRGNDEALNTQNDYQDPSANTQKREPVRVERKIGRNDKVDIQHVMTGEKKSMKFKQAEPMLETGQWVVIE